MLEDYNVVLPLYIENIFFLAVKFTGQCKKGYSKEIAFEWKIKHYAVYELNTHLGQDLYVTEKDLTL